MKTTYPTHDGHTVTVLSCDGAGCAAKIHALGAPAVLRAERILRPDGAEHYCPACQVRRGPGLVQIPHPEHG